MQISIWKKGLLLIIIILFLSSIIPSINGNMIIEKNNQNESSRFVCKIYMLGTIYDLIHDEEMGYYQFHYNNLRYLIFERVDFRYWDITYGHHGNTDGLWELMGFNFRGILRPTFICGCFHIMS